VVLAGNYAIETGVFGLSWKRAGAKAVTDSGKYLMVWKREPDGSFKIYRDIFNSDRPAPR
jgi:ketosteroid isomerase-like protein